MNSQSRKIISYSGIAFIGILVLFFAFRNTILNLVIKKKLETYSERYATQISIKHAAFNGLNGLLIQGVQVAPSSSDTLLKVDSILLNIRILPLLLGKIRFSNLEISNTYAHAIKRADRNNLSILTKSKKEEKVDSILTTKTNYGELAEKFLNTIFDAIPSSVNFRNSVIKCETDSMNLIVSVPQLAIKNNEFMTQINFIENKEIRSWVALGDIYTDERKVNLKVFPFEKMNAEFPLLKQKWKLRVGFDTLKMNLNSVEYENDELLLKGEVSVQNLKVKHWRISPNDVVINNQNIDFSFHIGTNFFQVDSSTIVTYNKVSYRPFLKFQIYPVRQLQLDVSMEECKAADFFESFPTGLFENIDGIKVKGRLFFHLHFFIDTNHPDDLQFASSLRKKDFKITGYGATSLTKINGEFTYTAYEKGRAVRSFMVGPSNPNYTPIEQISTTLKSALLTSEDGNFYSHNGFNEDAFRKSIATNFKEKRFVRGGSTISMQLVKNVFLTRNKTVARKIEEALIVWLIENNRLSSKERMYEVYLNLIEWGPNVYGIGEASRFYFSKSPADLTLEESIFLAMIVPRPKGFKYNFGVDGKLRESVSGYYSIVAGHMVKKGIITEDEKVRLVPNVELKGAAKAMITVSDTTAVPQSEEDELNIDN